MGCSGTPGIHTTGAAAREPNTHSRPRNLPTCGVHGRCYADAGDEAGVAAEALVGLAADQRKDLPAMGEKEEQEQEELVDEEGDTVCTPPGAGSSPSLRSGFAGLMGTDAVAH